MCTESFQLSRAKPEPTICAFGDVWLNVTEAFGVKLSPPQIRPRYVARPRSRIRYAHANMHTFLFKHAWIFCCRLPVRVFSGLRGTFFSIACKHWANHQTLPCTYAKPFDTKNKQSNGSLSSKRTAGLVQDFLFYTDMNDIFICTITLSQTQRLWNQIKLPNQNRWYDLAVQ